MSSLTSEMVFLKTKAKDLKSIRKLNFWACNLNDVSLLKDTPNVEILTLSVNNITSLKDIQYCTKLSELYIRNNKIKSLKEIYYLKELKNLRILWLEENQCANTTNYRLTVLKNLPYLHKLDNLVVSKEEIDQASNEGDDINSPPSDDDNRDDEDSNEIFNSISYQEKANNYILPKNEEVETEDRNDQLTSIETDLSPATTTNISDENRESDYLQNTETDLPMSNLNSFDFSEFITNDEKINAEKNDSTKELNTFQEKLSINKQNPNVLSAVLILLKDLNTHELDQVVQECQDRKKIIDLLKD